jgi:hypothetical protein
MMNIEGCVHIYVKNGKMINAFSHLTNIPENCIIHLSPDAVFFTEEEFEQDHYRYGISDELKLNANPQGKIYDLGDTSETEDDQA